MNVKGLKISDILNIDLDTFNNMNESKLRSITSRLVSAGNKRIRRLKEHDINAPALQGLGKQQVFSTKLPEDVSKQQRVNRLRSEFARIRSFLTSETSTISGYNKFKKRTTERIAKELNIDIETLKDKIDIGKLFDMLHKAQHDGYAPAYRGSAGSKQARNIIADILIEDPDLNESVLMQTLDKEMQEYYKSQEAPEDETKATDL